MNKSALKRFATQARLDLMVMVNTKLGYLLSLYESSLPIEYRDHAGNIQKIKERCSKNGKIDNEIKDDFVEEVAYTWFNRLIALRFMDANEITEFAVISTTEKQILPPIYTKAKEGMIDKDLRFDRDKFFSLIDGKISASIPDNEAFKMLFIAVCNYYSTIMPFMFEAISDYTELLLPDDMLSPNSIRAVVVGAMPTEDCKDVEIIGWLYQYYIAEKKEKAMAKKSKYKTSEIPAVTQLFTPDWIVKYMVENTLGKLWILNNPTSALKSSMDYYIDNPEQDNDFLRIKSPEELTIFDPCCGSGHILTYAFDILVKIYEESGYNSSEIPFLILEKNLYGCDIDKRAATLAQFAMAMKARLYYRRFFKTTVKTNILELNDFGSEEFKDIKTFGSLLTPDTKNTFDDGVFGQNIPEYDLQIKLLTGKFHCVITNPPYMGGGGMNPLLGDFVKNRYPEAKSDLFSAFMIRNTELTLPQGQLGFMTPFVWMFISSYEKLRAFLIDEKTITSLIQLEYSAFDGATVPICTFTLENSHKPNYLGGYIKLSDFKGSENQAPKTLEAIRNKNCGWFYGVSAFNFKKIPSSPISYWASPDLMSIFENSTLLSKLARPCQGMATTNNGLFLRNWFEVTSEKVGLSFDSEEAANISKLKWFPYNKGGDFRKWYGNAQYVINFENKGQTICDYIDNTPNVNVGSNGRVINRGRFFKESISWSKISSSNIALRYYPKGFIFDVAGTSIFADKNILLALIGFMNSFVSRSILSILSPTLNFEVGHINSLPVVNEVLASLQDKVNNITIQLINIEKQDWDSYESSWDFSSLPLLQNEYKKSSIEESYKTLRAFWQTQIDTMKKLEEENNDIFIKAYGLEDEIKLEVPLKEITLTCNPSYRYDHKKSDEELESLLLADTMKELISYGVGCMFGRYSLDKPGLILANQGDTIGEYLKEISNSTFPIDDDNIIPILEDDFFTDDIASRFIEFIKVAFGEEHHAKNIQFIEDAIGKSIRKYFVKGFYDDHIKRYKKRPIYWMVSSPKKSFNALIYMHRYQDDIFARVQNNYLREYITKLEAAMHTATTIANDESNSAVDRRKATKDIETITKKIDELIKFDRDKLTPFAQSRTPIDLDDGVKVNYSKFEEILYPIPGLKSEE